MTKRVSKGSRKGGQFAPDESGKTQIPTSTEELDRLHDEVSEAENKAWRNNEPADYAEYERKRDQYEKNLFDNAMIVIETLEVNDKINISFSHTKQDGTRAPKISVEDEILDPDTLKELKKSGEYIHDGNTFRVLAVERVGKASKKELQQFEDDIRKTEEATVLVKNLIKEFHTFSKKEKALLAKAIVTMSKEPKFDHYQFIVDSVTGDDYTLVLPGMGEFLPETGAMGLSAEDIAPYQSILYYGLADQLREELPPLAVAIFQKPFLSLRPDFK